MDEYNTAFTFSICLHKILSFPDVYHFKRCKLYMFFFFQMMKTVTVLIANTFPKTHYPNVLSLCFLVHFLLIKNIKALLQQSP